MQHIIYSRVSSNSQGVDSLETQNTICLSHLNSNGFILSNSHSEVSSAYNGKQAVLENLIKNTKNAIVYIKNVSRFSRNVIYGLNLIEKAKENNVHFHFVDDNLSTYNESHSHLIRTKISESQLESETISKRARDSYKVKKSKGWVFGQPAFGYKASVKKGVRKIEKNPEEKRIIDFIIQARQGTSSKLLNSKLKKINNNLDPIDFYDEEGKKIDNFTNPNTLTNSEVADLLNDYKIKKRKRDWTDSSVKNVYNTEIKHEQKMLNKLTNFSI